MLIDCPECGRKVSDKAPTCPQCGVIIGKPTFYRYASGSLDLEWLLMDYAELHTSKHKNSEVGGGSVSRICYCLREWPYERQDWRYHCEDILDSIVERKAQLHQNSEEAMQLVLLEQFVAALRALCSEDFQEPSRKWLGQLDWIAERLSPLVEQCSRDADKKFVLTALDDCRKEIDSCKSILNTPPPLPPPRSD